MTSPTFSRASLDARAAERATHYAVIERVRAACLADGGRNPSVEESAQVRAAQSNIARIDNDTAVLTRVNADQNLSALRSQTRTAPTGRGWEWQAQTRLREDYTPERSAKGERSFFSDLYNAERGDMGARERIEQARQERAASSSSFAGLVPVNYLTDLAALVARAARPFADSVTHVELSDTGTQLIIPRGTTGASAAVQATENSAVSQTDEVFTNLTLPVATIAGSAQPSRQALERGAKGIDELIMTDLAGAYAAALESQCLTGSGGSGQVLGVQNTSGINQATAFGAAATTATFMTKCAGQVSAITGSRYLPPTKIVMHPRRWAWLLSQVDSSGRPLAVPVQNGPNNAFALGDSNVAYGSSAGLFMGLDVVVSAAVPTSVGTGPEDLVWLYRAEDILLFENGDGTPQQLSFEQTAGNSLTVTMVAYGYVAFSAGRYPTAVGQVGGNAGSAGNGLVAPTF